MTLLIQKIIYLSFSWCNCWWYNRWFSICCFNCTWL